MFMYTPLSQPGERTVRERDDHLVSGNLLPCSYHSSNDEHVSGKNNLLLTVLSTSRKPHLYTR